jgi:hypothetical protein
VWPRAHFVTIVSSKICEGCVDTKHRCSFCVEGHVSCGFYRMKWPSVSSGRGPHSSPGLFCVVCGGQCTGSFVSAFVFYVIVVPPMLHNHISLISCWCCIKLAVEVVLNEVLYCSSIAPQAFVSSYLHLHEENTVFPGL